LNVDEVVAHLDFLWGEAPLLDRLVNTCLIRETLEQDPVTLSDEELQEALNTFPRRHRLHRAEDTRRWMERHGRGDEQCEGLAAEEALIRKLRDRVAAGGVEEYFDRHSSDFDTADIARVDFRDEAEARRVAGEVCTGLVSFYEAAERRFLAR